MPRPIATDLGLLQALQTMYERAAARGDIPLAAKLIEQAAKISGGMFVNNTKEGGEDLIPPTPERFTYNVVDARRPSTDADDNG